MAKNVPVKISLVNRVDFKLSVKQALGTGIRCPVNALIIRTFSNEDFEIFQILPSLQCHDR
jgi:hypothetical protein